jgi:uncharacterized NAD(P)/FAD-binding protein YdhS
MDIALKKLELVQRLLSIWDEAALQRVAKVIEKEVPEASPAFEQEVTDEDVAELDAEHEKALRGEGPSYTWEEVKEMARKAVKR